MNKFIKKANSVLNFWILIKVQFYKLNFEKFKILKLFLESLDFIELYGFFLEFLRISLFFRTMSTL